MKQNIEKKLFYEKIINLPFLQAFSKKKYLNLESKNCSKFWIIYKMHRSQFFPAKLSSWNEIWRLYNKINVCELLPSLVQNFMGFVYFVQNWYFKPYSSH